MLPRSLELTSFTVIDETTLNPMLKFALEFLAEVQRMRRFVTIKIPRSPLLPFVSSTALIESIWNSPFRSLCWRVTK